MGEQYVNFKIFCYRNINGSRVKIDPTAMIFDSRKRTFDRFSVRVHASRIDSLKVERELSYPPWGLCSWIVSVRTPEFSEGL